MKKIKDNKLITIKEKSLNDMHMYDLNKLLSDEYNRRILIIDAKHKQIKNGSSWWGFWGFGPLSPELILVDIDNNNKFIFNQLLTYKEVKIWLINEINKLANERGLENEDS